MGKPDWEAFGKAIIDNAIDATDIGGDLIEELALKHNVLKIIPYDPKVHDGECYLMEAGDDWIIPNYSTGEA